MTLFSVRRPPLASLSPDEERRRSALLISKEQRDYTQQYFNIYVARLRALGRRVAAQAAAICGADVKVVRLCELEHLKDGAGDVVIIGTIFKDQKLKPNILAMLGFVSDESPSDAINESTLQPESTTYVSESDVIYLEDNTQRIKLRGSDVLDKEFLVTGVVCGCLGREVEPGKFDVKQIMFAQPQPSPRVCQPSRTTEKRYMLLLSGLELSERVNSCYLDMQLLVDWITGMIGERSDVECQTSRICRVLIAGNSLNASTRDDPADPARARYLTKDESARSVDGVKALDDFLAQLTSVGDGLEVDIMPGRYDPANQSWPQQPLPAFLLPRETRLNGSIRPRSKNDLQPFTLPLHAGASAYNSFHSLTNPVFTSISGVASEDGSDAPQPPPQILMCGSAGYNLDDVRLNTQLPTASDDKDANNASSAASAVDLLERLLHWSHVAPTCPDTVACFPFVGRDPFVIEETPDLMFVGNQDVFEMRQTQHGDKTVTLVAVPRFARTRSAVLLNLADMADTTEIRFDATFD